MKLFRENSRWRRARGPACRYWKRIQVKKEIMKNTWLVKINVWHRVTHKGWDCKDDLKFDDSKFKSSLLPCIRSLNGWFNDLAKKVYSCRESYIKLRKQRGGGGFWGHTCGKNSCFLLTLHANNNITNLFPLQISKLFFLKLFDEL